MDLPPFLLDEWLAKHEFRAGSDLHNLASSTGPSWTVSELKALGGGGLDLSGLALGYAPPEGSEALRAEIARLYGADPDSVLITHGASEAISLLFCLAASSGANVVLPRPGFPPFEVLARAWGLEIRWIDLSRHSAFRQSAQDVLDVVDGRTVLALVNSPHNPTGSVMALEETALLARSLADAGIPLIVDEVYHPVAHRQPATSASGLPNVTIVSDMSKALSLSGLRIGWIVEPDEERRTKLVNARSLFSISGSPLTEALAEHALRNRGAILERVSKIAAANISVLDGLFARTDRLAWIRPEGGTICYPW